MTTKLLTILCLTTLSFSCAKKTESPASYTQTEATKNSIINGKPTTKHDKLAKSVVGLVSNEDTKYTFCTGSVLNKRFILTAAHCLSYKNADEILISFSNRSLPYELQSDSKTKLSEKTIQSQFNLRKVKRFITHPEYDGSGNHDLAIIMLQSEIPSFANPVELLPDSLINTTENKTAFDQQNLRVTLIGHGIYKEAPRTSTRVLRRTTVNARFENQLVITDQTKGSGGCNGDSGGPAFLDYNGVTYQVGVTHGPHGDSRTCHEEGEWMNPALDKGFIQEALIELSKKH